MDRPRTLTVRCFNLGCETDAEVPVRVGKRPTGICPRCGWPAGIPFKVNKPARWLRRLEYRAAHNG